MIPDHNTQHLRARTRRRLRYAAVVLVLYFAFALNWTTPGQVLARPLGDSPVTGSLLMFAALIILFLLLEVLFLWRQRGARGEEERPSD